MKKISFISILCFIIVFKPVKSIAQISDDAVHLTLRIQSQIELDLILAQHIDSSLILARSLNDSLASIQVFPEFTPKKLIVNTTAAWSEAWKNDSIFTGDIFIDSLSKQYGLTSVKLFLFSSWFELIYSRPLQMNLLAELYKKHPDVIVASPSHYGGDGDNIEYFLKNGIDHFAFSHGWADCPAGCIERYYWYVTVRQDDTSSTAQLEEGTRQGGIQLYRWNIPERYLMGMFPDADSIINAVKFSPHWWVRKHAVEGIVSLFTQSGPGYGEEDFTHWKFLKEQVSARKNDIINALTVATGDSDSDVRSSATRALHYIHALLIGNPEVQPKQFFLYQNYPNPFNPTTTISYQVPISGTVTLKVFDVLGREVAVLVNEMKRAGTYDVQFNALKLSSGIYFYRLQAGGFAQTKKMLLLK